MTGGAKRGVCVGLLFLRGGGAVVRGEGWELYLGLIFFYLFFFWPPL